MRLNVDLDLRQITAGPGTTSAVSALFFTRGDSEDLTIQFSRDGLVVDPNPNTVFFCVKAVGTFDGDPLILHTAFTKTGTGATAAWTGTPDFGTAGINSLLGLGAGLDLASVTLSAEVGFNISGRDTSARTVRCIVENDLYRGTESAPPAYPRSGTITFYSTLVGLTGGGATKLDGLPTVGVNVGVVAQVILAGVLQSFQLQSGTTAEDGTTVIRPDDYAAATNEKVWVQLSSVAASGGGGLQPVAVDYRGAYNNGDGTYAVGSVVLFNGSLYKKIGNPGNPGYAPGGTDWQLFEPLIGSPAYDLWVRTSFGYRAPVAMLSGLYDHWPLATNTNSSLGAVTVYVEEGSPVFEGGGMTLDGSSWLTSTTTLPLETGFTVSAWVNPVPTNNGGAVSQWMNGKGGFRLGVDNTPVDRDLFATSNSGGRFVSGHYVIGYYMLTGVYDALRGQLLLYRNNVLSDISLTAGLYSTGGGPAAVFQIGTIDTGHEFVYEGFISNVAIWNRPFTQAQVTALYNGGTPLPFASYATTIA